MFFFFKQKTAYEMRISDWSSDVCSSDLWLFDAMMEAHVPCAPVRTLDEVVNDPNMHARGALEWQDHPQFGRIVVQQSPLRFDGSERFPLTPSRALGADTDAVLKERLGWDDARVAAATGRVARNWRAGSGCGQAGEGRGERKSTRLNPGQR